MNVNSVLQNISSKQKKASAIVDIDRNISFDAGNLTVFDSESVVLPKAGDPREDYFRKTARDNVQVVLNRLYAMEDTQVVDGERVLNLPAATTILPRGKAVPKPKEPTKWERFANAKGIKSKSSKTRDKLVWDDVTRKWVPRYGYKKVQNDREKNWCVEVKE